MRRPTAVQLLSEASDARLSVMQELYLPVLASKQACAGVRFKQDDGNNDSGAGAEHTVESHTSDPFGRNSMTAIVPLAQEYSETTFNTSTP